MADQGGTPARLFREDRTMRLPRSVSDHHPTMGDLLRLARPVALSEACTSCREAVQGCAASKWPQVPRSRRLMVGIVWVFLLAGSITHLSAQSRLLLTGATLIDGTENPPMSDARVLIVDGRFACVSGAGGCTDADTPELDLRGHWLTPGLIDTHVHLDFNAGPEAVASDQALRFALGITMVRDAGTGPVPQFLAARETSNDPRRPVPRLLVSGLLADISVDAAGRPRGSSLVRYYADMGVDALKLKGRLDGEAWKEEVRTGASLGLPVYGHTWYGPPPVVRTSEAIEAGLNGLSHLLSFAPAAQPLGSDLTEPPESEGSAAFWAWRQGLWLTADQDRLEAQMTELLENGVWLEPLLVEDYYWTTSPEPPAWRSFLRDGPPGLREMLGIADAPPSTPFMPAYQREAEFVQRFHERGGVVIAGSDAERPGVGLHAEIRLLREAGLSAQEALRAATANAAVALRRPDLGVIAVGNLADVAVYDRNPLGEFDNTYSVTHVIKEGVVYRTNDLLAPYRESYRAALWRVWLDRARRGIRLLALPFLVLAAGLILLWSSQRRRRADGAHKGRA